MTNPVPHAEDFAGDRPIVFRGGTVITVDSAGVLENADVLIIGDSPFWAGKTAAVDAYSSRTPGGELATMADIVSATISLLDNHGMSGTSIDVDRGWRLT